MSVKRLKNFLKNEELDEKNVIHDQTAGMNSISFCSTALSRRVTRVLDY